MTTQIVKQDIQELIEAWIDAERKGEKFPVPLHDHWAIAGHRKKQDSFNLVESLLEEGIDFLRLTVKTPKGRPVKGLMLTFAGLEHLCLAAHTEQGKQVREVYRQAKQKWDLVQQVSPGVAREVEMMALKIELAKIEAQKEQAIAQSKQADLQLVQFRHFVTTALPEPVQQKILGYATVDRVEYRDRIIHDDDVVNDGSTIGKGELCRRYNILTRNGKPDYKRLNAILEKLPSDAFGLTVRLQDNQELLRDWLPKLDRLVDDRDRNLYLGE